MAETKKPFMVLVKETRLKPMIVWADGESDASWKALSLCQQGIASTDGCEPAHTIHSIRGADYIDRRMFPEYGREECE